MAVRVRVRVRGGVATSSPDTSRQAAAGRAASEQGVVRNYQYHQRAAVSIRRGSRTRTRARGDASGGPDAGGGFGRRALTAVLLSVGVPYVGLNIANDLGFNVGEEDQPAPLPAVTPGLREAAFAGGCFWCMEAPFDRLGDGVLATTSGYTGGSVDRPSYRQVSSGATGHAETVRVLYDPNKVSYEQLLDAFFHSVDPTVKDRQFVDVGTQYRTAIFYYDEEQRAAAEKKIAELEAAGRFGGAPIVTEVTKASTFWPAENYHQDYYKKSASKYSFYRSLSGRDEYIESVWGSAK